MTFEQQLKAVHHGVAARAQRSLRRWARRGSAALALAAALWSSSAQAQRGEDYALHEELAVSSSPDDGFPGPFDTQLAAKGRVVVSLPASSVYWGLTRELSLGTVLWSYVPLASGLPSGSVHARYRLGSTSWFRSTADAVFFGMQMHGEDQKNNPLWTALLGSNTELALHDAHRLTVTGWLAHVSGSPGDGVAASVTAAALGGTYSLVFARWGALHLTGLYLVSGTGAMGRTGMNVDIDWTNGINASDRLLARGLLNFRSGSWLFGVGAVRTGSLVTPWLNVGFQVGG